MSQPAVAVAVAGEQLVELHPILWPPRLYRGSRSHFHRRKYTEATR